MNDLEDRQIPAVLKRTKAIQKVNHVVRTREKERKLHFGAHGQNRFREIQFQRNGGMH